MEKSKLQPLLLVNNDCFTIRCDLAVIQDPRTEAVASTIVVPQPNLQQHFERMLKDGRGTDVTFSVAGELFRAHRCVLAARSPVFQAELFGPVKEQATHTHCYLQSLRRFSTSSTQIAATPVEMW
jgi:speckle-type POZ protein